MFDSWLSRLLPPRAGHRVAGGRWPGTPGAHPVRRPGPGAAARRQGGPELAAVADALWYPIWDAGVGLDHSVRTPQQALAVAADDLKALLGMLDARHVAGDPALTGLVREQVISRWRRSAPAKVARAAGAGPRPVAQPRRRVLPAGAGSQGLPGRVARLGGTARTRLGASAGPDAGGACRPARCCSTCAASCTGWPAAPADVLRAQDRDSVAEALGMRRPGRGAAGGATRRPGRWPTPPTPPGAGWRRRAPAPRSLLGRLRPGASRGGTHDAGSGRRPGGPDAAGQGRGGPGRRGGAGPRRRPVGRSGADAAGGPGGRGRRTCRSRPTR